LIELARALTGYGHPRKDRTAELRSLQFQLGRIVQPQVDTRYWYNRAVEILQPCYPGYYAPTLDDESIFKRLCHLAQMRLVPTSSPGFPLCNQFATTSLCLLNYGGLIISIAFFRVKWLLDNDASKYSPLELLDKCIADFWKAHIKEEPHPQPKIDTGRFRIIFGGSIVNALVERFFFQEYQDECAAIWLRIPSKPGIGFTDEMASDFRKCHIDYDKITSDISGWDFSVRADLMLSAFKIRERCCLNPSERWLRGIKSYAHLLAYKILTLSGGDSFLLDDGIMVSGSFCTASLNSDMRNIVAIAIDLSLGVDPSQIIPSRYATMGDDIIQPDYGFTDQQIIDAHLLFGFRVTDFNRVLAQHDFEFCSHMFHARGPSLVTSARTLFRLIHHAPSAELVLQFVHECRWNDNLAQLLTLLFCSGWKIELPDHGQCVPAPTFYEGLSFSMSRKMRNNRGPIAEVVVVPNQTARKRNKKKKAGKASMPNDKRWYVGVGKTSLGPFSTEGFGLGSGTAPANLGRARSTRNDDNHALAGLPQAPEGAVRVNMRRSHVTSNVFHRREMIGPINGNVNFGVTEWRINPGNPTLFPWLSQLADLYEKYKVHDLSFVFVQTGSGFAAANVSGRCVMGCDYDVMTPPVASDQEAEMKDPSVPFAPYETAILTVSPQMLNKTPLFLRGDSYPPGSDPKTYDGGKLFFCSVGTPNSNQIGTLYVDYNIELFTPQLPEGEIKAAPIYQIANYRGTADMSLTSSSIGQPLPFTRYTGPNGGSLEVTHGDGTPVFRFQAGTYRISGFVKFRTSGTMSIAFLTASINSQNNSPPGFRDVALNLTGGSVTNGLLVLGFNIVLALNTADTVELYVGATWAAPPAPVIDALGSDFTIEVL